MYEIRIKSPHLIAMWWSVRECVQYSEDANPLIEAMKYIASKKKETTKEYKFKVDHDTALIAYNCIKFALENELPKDKEQLPTFFVAMERLAQMLDMTAAREMTNKMSPLKLVKM